MVDIVGKVAEVDGVSWDWSHRTWFGVLMADMLR